MAIFVFIRKINKIIHSLNILYSYVFRSCYSGLDVITDEMETNNDPFIIFVPTLSMFDPNLSCVYHFIVSFCLVTLPLPDDPFKIPQI